MASKLPPVKNEALTFSTVLYAQSDNQQKTTPTLAAGDVKISKDNGAIANPGTLPAEDPASSGIVKIVLTATEMNADEIVINFVDASGDEWHSQTIVLHTVAPGQQFDDLLDDAVLTDSVATDGSIPTISQAIYMMTQFLTERAVSSTTVTVKKVDGSTSLMTFTLDSATSPTSITRTS